MALHGIPWESRRVKEDAPDPGDADAKLTGRAVPITDEICQVGGRGLSAPNDAAIYLVSVDGCAALIDAGCGDATDMILANGEAAGAA